MREQTDLMDKKVCELNITPSYRVALLSKDTNLHDKIIFFFAIYGYEVGMHFGTLILSIIKCF